LVLELIIVDNDYDDDDLLMMNACMKNEDENDDDFLLNVCIVDSYLHAFISRIFIPNEEDWDIISNEDDHNTLYSNDEDYDAFVS